MKPSKQGGRPREFDPDVALEAATAEFWKHGFSSTTVDAVSSRMGMSKPSVYAAFGTKDDLYRKSLETFCEGLVGAIDACDVTNDSLEAVLTRFFEREIDFYGQGHPPRGCFLVCTAPSETANCTEVQEILLSTVRRIDKSFERLLRRAVEFGKLSPSTHVPATAMALQAILQSLAIRTRAGQPRRLLLRFAKQSVRTVLADD